MADKQDAVADGDAEDVTNPAIEAMDRTGARPRPGGASLPGSLELLSDIRSDPELPAVPVLAYCAEGDDGNTGLALAAGAQGLLHHDDRDFGDLRRAAEHFDPVAC